HEMQARQGGKYHMSFVNFSTGKSHSFGGSYVEIRQNEFLKYTDTFDDPNLPGEMVTTVWLKEVLGGTDLKITQENIPAMIPLEMCYLGWQESLDKLTRLVEPEIPDGV
ncbi:MAG TPA: SRPBCC domain-containing protein, partial [Chitinophagaceae bacterium]|nr:SRPBCC domain-containing protein [Chitinophagaceae bacterium]